MIYYGKLTVVLVHYRYFFDEPHPGGDITVQLAEESRYGPTTPQLQNCHTCYIGSFAQCSGVGDRQNQEDGCGVRTTVSQMALLFVTQVEPLSLKKHLEGLLTKLVHSILSAVWYHV